MLVLTRRVNERLLIPSIQTTVQILSARPTGVRLGISAPPEITVLREEVSLDPAIRPGPDAVAVEKQPLPWHRLRNRLNNLSLGLALLRRLAGAGQSQELQVTLDTLDREFADLRLQLGSLQREKGDAGEPLAADSWHI